MKYKGVLLDFDGTIVDSEISRLESLNEVLKEFKVNISLKEWEEKFRSLGSATILDYFKKQNSLEFNTQKLYELSHKIRDQIELKEGVPLIKGFLHFLHFLQKNSIPFYICSGGKANHVKKVLKMHNLEELPSFGREEYLERKPAPDAYLKGLEKLGLDSKDVIVFDDAKTGCQAGINARCDVIAINYSEGEGFEELNLKGKYKNWDEFDFENLFR